MKKIRITFITLLLSFCGAGMISAQGIIFFEGDLPAALEKAKKENKILFLDFYADWCAPCKQMEKNVFSNQEVGDYFNAGIVALKIDTEAAANKQIVKKYKANSLPTYVFINVEEKILSQAVGAMAADKFLKMARIAKGDELAFADLYERFRTSKGDMDLMRQVLVEAPYYVSTLEGMEQEKWVVRVERVFKDYIGKKMGPQLINADDYKIINAFHRPEKAGDNIVEFINTNIKAYLEQVGEGPAYYVVEFNDKVTGDMARAGNEDYKKYLDRIKGDMKAAYEVLPATNLSPYERNKYTYDAEYQLFYKKNSEEYVRLTDEYFSRMGESLNTSDYGSAAQKIYQATGGKVADDIHRKAKDWIIKALQYEDTPLMDKLNLLTMLGDSHKILKEYEEARKCYNQAFMESIQLKEEMTQAMIQMRIQQKIASLELLE